VADELILLIAVFIVIPLGLFIVMWKNKKND